MKLFFLLIFLISSSNVFANGQVISIEDSEELFVDLYDLDGFKEESIVIIVSRKTNKAIAYGKIERIDREAIPHPALVRIIEIIDNSLVIPKDFIYPLSYKILKEKKIPGFASLTATGQRNMPARFKELASFGVFTSEGHTLDKHETLLSLFKVQYGITNDVNLQVVNALWLDGYANAGVKVAALRNKYAKVTVHSLGAHSFKNNDNIWQAGGVVTLPQNAKFQNHFMVTMTFDEQSDSAKATKDFNLFKDSDIRNISEYITDDWNRLLWGPTYNVELQTFGGTISYMWIWDTFHMSLGMATRDFTELKVGRDGYYYVYDLFWRF